MIVAEEGPSPRDVEALHEEPVRAVETIDGGVVVRLAGELDLYNADAVRSGLARALSAAPARLVVDLAEVAALARATARRLGLSEEAIDEIVRAAELHDIGKAAIPDAILDKPGPLSDAEQDFVQGHTVIGERIISAAQALRPVARLVRHSHERFDGGGYPDGLEAIEIPLGARIIAVCDAFEAMISPERAYRAAMTAAEAAEELRRCSGTQFDPEVVDAFAQVEDELRAIRRELAAA